MLRIISFVALLFYILSNNFISARNIDKSDKEKIVNYINCIYTAYYVNRDSRCTEEEKKHIQNIDIETISIDSAFVFKSLIDSLNKHNLKITANNLTKKLNDRNITIENDNFSLFVDRVLDIEDFRSFSLTREDESRVRQKIWDWYVKKVDKKEQSNITTNIPKEEANSTTEQNRIPWWVWPSLGINAIIVLIKIVQAIKSLVNGEDYYENRPLQTPTNFYYTKCTNLEKENKELRSQLNSCQSVERAKLIKEGESKNIKEKEHQTIEIKECPKNIDKYYAEIDVKNNIFFRVSTSSTKKSAYVIDEAKMSFTLIESEQLYEMLLPKVNTSGILEACEVKGCFAKNKKVIITPGQVQQEADGKWRIINKTIIEIK